MTEHEKIWEAIKELCGWPTPKMNLRGDTLDGLEWHDDRSRPTDAEIEAKIAEIEAGNV